MPVTDSLECSQEIKWIHTYFDHFTVEYYNGNIEQFLKIKFPTKESIKKFLVDGDGIHLNQCCIIRVLICSRCGRWD